MKLDGRCPKCGSEKVMRLAVIGDASDWVGSGGGAPTERQGQQLVPRQILATQTQTRGLFGGTSLSWAEGGRTEGYVCVGCGYLEEYLVDAASIDWSQVVGATPHRPKR